MCLVYAQSVFRGIQGRRIAEERAMMLTFLRAQDAAIERMTDKVRGEVRPHHATQKPLYILYILYIYIRHVSLYI